LILAANGGSCTLDVYFYPLALGDRSATMTLTGSADAGAGVSVSLSGTGGIGYYQVDASGDVAYAGDAGYYGDAGGLTLNQPIDRCNRRRGPSRGGARRRTPRCG